MAAQAGLQGGRKNCQNVNRISGVVPMRPDQGAVAGDPPESLAILVVGELALNLSELRARRAEILRAATRHGGYNVRVFAPLRAKRSHPAAMSIS